MIGRCSDMQARPLLPRPPRAVKSDAATAPFIPASVRHVVLPSPLLDVLAGLSSGRAHVGCGISSVGRELERVTRVSEATRFHSESECKSLYNNR